MDIHLFEIPKLLTEFPGLKIIKNCELKLIIEGKIEIAKLYGEIPIYDDYEIQIEILRNYPHKLPIVKEIGGKIKKYRHKFTNGSLCIGTEADIFVNLFPEYSLFRYVDEFVISYLFTYSYFIKFGVFPFGDRSHGFNGVLEFYQEHFDVSSKEEAKFILASIFDKSNVVKMKKVSNEYGNPVSFYQEKIEKAINSVFYSSYKKDFEKYKYKITEKRGGKQWLEMSRKKVFSQKV